MLWIFFFYSKDKFYSVFWLSITVHFIASLWSTFGDVGMDPGYIYRIILLLTSMLSIFLHYILQIFVCIFTYAFLNVHLRMAKSTCATTLPSICDMLLGENIYLYDLCGSWFQFALYFLSLNPISQFSPIVYHIHMFACSIVHFLLSTWA